MQEIFKKKELEISYLANGLKIITCTNENFQSTYCNYGIKYGSKDYTYKKNEQIIEHAPGIAHFLEHVMFNTTLGDAFERFSQHLASANAYTTYERTSYLFSANQNIEANLYILLDMVNEFYLSKAKVAKEKSIINAEIDMYDKDLNYEIYQQNLENCLSTSKYQQQILGTKEDIANITLEQLKQAHQDFYRPSNCILVIVGPNACDLIGQVQDYFEKKEGLTGGLNQQMTIEKIVNLEISDENEEATKPKVFIRDYARQNYHVISYLYKFPDCLSQAKINRYQLLANLLLEQQWSEINHDYNDLIKNQILDYQFDVEAQVHDNFMLISYYYNSRPKTNNEKVENVIEQFFLEKTTITEPEFSALINKRIGKVIKKMIEPKQIGELYANLENKNQNIDEYLTFLTNINFSEIASFIKEIKKIKKVKKATVISNKMI